MAFIHSYPDEALFQYLGEDLLESAHDDDECRFERLLRPVRVGEDLVHVLHQAAAGHGVRVVGRHLQQTVSDLCQPLSVKSGAELHNEHHHTALEEKHGHVTRLYQCYFPDVHTVSGVGI